ncbi:MAG: WecB/TagA/CpsF family glycosyltransferase [Opitutaceae bacterium]|nr:WecB/TagA/CpsF family glycosyltransferase [Opitutaceae bacterium]
MQPPRFNVQGVGISALSLAEASARIIAVRGQKNVGYICVTGVHGVSAAQTDHDLRAILNRAWLNTPDGMPLVWLGRWHGQRGITRVYGPDLLLRVCDEGRASGLRHYFYGGAPEVADQLADSLCRRFPGLCVTGTFTPPFRPLTAEESATLQTDVTQKNPDIIWVGLGTPKQEHFMARHFNHLKCGLMIGVGAAFDFHSGRLRQAPRWMQRSGLEWLFRLGQEPRRLAYRYLVYNPLFVLRTVAQLTGLRDYPVDSTARREGSE